MLRIIPSGSRTRCAKPKIHSSMSDCIKAGLPPQGRPALQSRQKLILEAQIAFLRRPHVRFVTLQFLSTQLQALLLLFDLLALDFQTVFGVL